MPTPGEPASASITVGLVQSRASDDPEANLQAHVRHAQDAARRGAQVVCLPELFRTTYFPQHEDAALFDLAEPIPGPSTQALCDVARRHGLVIVAPVFERRAAGLYHNSAAVIDADGTIAGVYRKMHIPDDPGFYEKFYFAPGDLGFKAFPTRHGRIGVLICWDQWYPEGARLTALQGADILFYPTAIGTAVGEPPAVCAQQQDAWTTIQRAHAIANGVFVAAANRVGREEGLDFWGRSFVSGPFGEILAQASPDKEEVLIAKCDRSRVETVRRGWPFLRDRRIDAYQGIDQRFLGP